MFIKFNGLLFTLGSLGVLIQRKITREVPICQNL